MNSKLVNGIIRITVSFTLIGALFFVMRKQLADVFDLLLNIKLQFFIAAVILAFVAHFFLAMRLKLFLNAQRIKINVKEAVGLTLIGYFFNNFLPTTVGGDVVKAHYASKKTEGKLHSFTSVFMDRFIGLLALVLMALFAFILLSGEIRSKIVIWPIWILFFIAIFFLSLLFNKKAISRISSVRMFNWVGKVHSSLTAFRGKRALFIKSFLVSLLAQTLLFGAAYFLTKGLYGFIPLVKLMLIMPIIYIVSMFPSINGLGVREGAFLVFFKPFIGAEKAFALSLLWLFLYVVVGLFGGFVYAFARHGKNPACSPEGCEVG